MSTPSQNFPAAEQAQSGSSNRTISKEKEKGKEEAQNRDAPEDIRVRIPPGLVEVKRIHCQESVIAKSQTKTETMEVRSQDAVILLNLRVDNGKVVVKFHGTPLEGALPNHGVNIVPPEKQLTDPPSSYAEVDSVRSGNLERMYTLQYSQQEARIVFCNESLFFQKVVTYDVVIAIPEALAKAQEEEAARIRALKLKPMNVEYIEQLFSMFPLYPRAFHAGLLRSKGENIESCVEFLLRLPPPSSSSSDTA
mmetsp:Transcript_81/g.152  ORF Transcript_81/g.152 Transcript_81/m.152 type:complete len:251 (-) Transcript_81:57-809(-)